MSILEHKSPDYTQSINIASCDNIEKIRILVDKLIIDKEKLDTENIIIFFSEKIDQILDLNLVENKLIIEWYEILWFSRFKDLPNWEKTLEIKIAWEVKSDTVYLTKDFKIFKTESWRKVFHIWQIVDITRKRTREVVWKWTGIIIEHWIWSFPVKLICKWEIMLNTFPDINPFIKNNKE